MITPETDGSQSVRRRHDGPTHYDEAADSRTTYTPYLPSPKTQFSSTKPQSSTITNQIILNIKVIFELSFLILPYILQPINFIQIYFPHINTMFGRSTFNPSTSIPVLTDKVILVTGGNNGLGKEAILQLAQHSPAKIYMAARSADKAAEAIKSITSQLPASQKCDIEHLPLDLNSLASVRSAANIVTSKSSRLDILMLNAGIMATPAARTVEGFDSQLGVNHVGHFYLTQLLLPLLQTTANLPGADVRVVSLSSEAYNLGPSDINLITNKEKLPTQSAWNRYGASKTANILFAAELARRYPMITSTSVHPGIIMTDLHAPGQDSYSFVGWFMKLASPLISSDVPHGTYNQLWAATAPKSEIANGAYFTPVGKQQKSLKWATNKAAGKQLWEWTETEVKKAGF